MPSPAPPPSLILPPSGPPITGYVVATDLVQENIALRKKCRMLEERGRKMEEENELLRQQTSDLRGSIGLPTRPILDLTPDQQKYLGVLMEKIEVHHEVLRCATIGKGRGATDPSTMRVQVTRLRRKLKGVGVELETIWGVGYRIGEEGKRKVREMMEGEAR